MDKNTKFIINEQRINRYIAYQLTARELNSFEQYYFEYPEIIGDIERLRHIQPMSLSVFKDSFSC